MKKNSILTIASMLPEKVLYDAACSYVVKLAQAGNLEPAENLYENLSFNILNLEKLAEGARSLVDGHLKRHELEQAIYIYDHFPDWKKSRTVLGERLKTLHLLVFTLIPDHFTAAYKLWLEYGEYDLDACDKWQWVVTGLALLDFCSKNSNSDGAEIYRLIKKHGACEITRNFMDKADKLMEKIESGGRNRQ